ncbi:ATP-binding protein [Aliarcobacter cryaerophilus]|uniref:ATPase n=1 Tax=Aliarcobacter cryaerophilus TaxID=28198 RepID=A0A2S9TG41_9BACT|nr:ATP-binding protein [Aliarcobacter cryaerophilus]PRM97789.1 ATPase [Arcobacter cryaerophilus gv. crypticus]
MEHILLEDNNHWINSKVYDDFIPRRALKKAKEFLKAKEVLALIGARRVGKSTLAKLLIKDLLEQGVKSSNIFFINLEKPSFLPYKNDSSYLGKIYDEYLKLANPNLNEKIYFFIDEIQIFQNWQVFIKSKYENSNIKFVITGSNSSLLTENYATVLTGRVLKLNISTFSFKEFLEYKKIDISSNIQITKNRIDIKRAFDEYLKWGGYFSVISNENEELKKEILKNIAEDIILKDIVPRYSIKNSSQIRDLFFYIVSNSTNIVNYSNLANKLKIDSKTVKEYLEYFEDNFLIKTISNYNHKLSEQIKSSKKVYVSDNGFLNLSIFSKQNFGVSFENLVFLYLKDKDENLTYLKDKQEIDFYSNKTMYQVSFSIVDEATRKRELIAFESFDKFQVDKKILITYDEDEILNDINIVSCDNFLLN